LYNAHGDVVQLANSAGAVTKSYRYDGFGNEVGIDEADANPYRYAGMLYDKETRTYYDLARYYSPILGRFTQQDDWSYMDANDPLSLNLYLYCTNNPIMYFDPTGHDSAANLEYCLTHPEPTDSYSWEWEEWWYGAEAAYYGGTSMHSMDAITQAIQESAKGNGTPLSNMTEELVCKDLGVAYPLGSSVKNGDFNSIKSDVDLVARILFHEDATIQGQLGVAWTILNRYNDGEGSIRDIILNWYTPYLGKDTLDEFFRPKEWMQGHPKWDSIHGIAGGQPTVNNWINAVRLAYGVIEGSLVDNPFVGVASNPTNVIQYIGMFGASETVKNSPNYYRYGNSHFKIG